MMTELYENRGTVDETKERLVRDVKSVGADADELIRGVVRSTADEVAAVRARIEGRLGDAKAKFDSARSTVTNKARCTADATHEYVRENPWRVIGIAAAVGVLVGILARRR